MRRVLAGGLAVTTGAGAVLLLACTVLPLLLLGGSGRPTDWLRDPAWPHLSVLAFVLTALMPVVMLAIYLPQIEQVGVLGLLGLVASLVGSCDGGSMVS